MHRKKTRNRRPDNALISIKIEPEIMPLVQKYRDTTGARVFKFYQMYSTCNTFQFAINRGLKLIGNIVGADDLEFYAARHTWATIASNSVGIDKYTIHTALNHVIQEMKVTEMYIKKDWQVIDKANRAVLDYIKLVNIT
ncbi:MAG: hypothetical protein LBJ63_04590 [Prevotellaceae bacterium]|nr:hypothetical protein [Prevotellaceae bacterium]